MAYCICGYTDGTNPTACERCKLLAEIETLRSTILRLDGLITEVVDSAIEYTSEGRYRSVQISESLWNTLSDAHDGFDDVSSSDENYVSPEDQKRNDAMARGDYLRDRAKDERAERGPTFRSTIAETGELDY